MMELVDMLELGSSEFFVGVQVPLSVIDGCVAQLVEQQAFNLLATGSNPVTPKKLTVTLELKI